MRVRFRSNKLKDIDIMVIKAGIRFRRVECKASIIESFTNPLNGSIHKGI